VALIIVSAVAFVPHYTKRTTGSTVEQQGGSQALGGSGGGGAAGGSSGSAGGGGGTSVIRGQGRTIGGSGGSGGSSGSTGLSKQDAAACAAGHNGGSTAPGVTASALNVASTIVTDGVGAGFLGEAQDGMQVAIDQKNQAGGVCGRRIALHTVNSSWDSQKGQQYIDNFISSGNTFALVGQPDSQGLDAAITSGLIDRAQIPVVGTDGLLKSQYGNGWVWPVGVSTVSNMHIIVQYAHDHLGATSPNDYGIVFDTVYKFGAEGAKAFDAEVKRVTGSDVGGYSAASDQCNSRYCGVASDKTDYSTEITQFNQGCNPACKVVVLLLEPQPAEAWMKGEQNATQWYKNLFGGEPLFDDTVGQNCPGCGGQTTACKVCTGMIVWTGYHAALQPFDSESAVAEFCGALKAAFPKDDCHNEFTEGAYLGMKLFIDAAERAGPNLTRSRLRDVLNSQTFSYGLTGTQTLQFGTSFPRVANASMTSYRDNYSGTFNGWSYMNNGFIGDPHSTQDLS